MTETLEVIPRQWKVIQHVREKFACRDCEAISQAPAPFHVIPRGWAGPSLLAMIAFEKFGQHQPLNRQAERYAREGVPLSLSTLADQVGAVCTVMQPVFERIEAHVFAGERLHADDTTVPVLAKGKTDIGRCWTYVRDDRPFAGPAPPAAVFYYSRDRRGEHPQAHLDLCPASCRPTPMAAMTLSTKPAKLRADPSGDVLGPWSAQALRARGHRRGRSPQGARQDRGRLAHRARSGKAHRRLVRYRADHQRPFRRRAADAPTGTERTPGRRTGRLDARATRQTLAP